MGFTPAFYTSLLIAVCGAFVAGFLVSLFSLSATVRKLLIAAGPVGAIVGLLIGNPQGLDGAAWAIIAGYGVLAWFGGLALGYLIHRLFDPTPRESLWSAFVRLISLR
jgi:hypothetical protein